ncbi:MAG: hypothetical protein QM642_09375 [Edaphocola sp.]
MDKETKTENLHVSPADGKPFVSRRCSGRYYNFKKGMEVCKHRETCAHVVDSWVVGMRHINIKNFRRCGFHNGG